MLLDPLTNPMPILIMAFVVGYIHILVGLGLKAYLMIRRGHSVDALFDVGFWYFVLVGLVIFAGGQMVIGSVVMASFGKWLAIAGAVGLVLTQGRDKKNPIMKLMSGILSLYDITGYFSDLLSYSRIMALGLATGVIAQVVNTMGTLPGANIIGAVVFVLVFLLGNQLMEKLDHSIYSLTGGIAATIVYLIACKPSFGDSGMLVDGNRFGPSGMFVAIVIGLLVGLIYHMYAKLHVLETARWSLTSFASGSTR